MQEKGFLVFACAHLTYTNKKTFIIDKNRSTDSKEVTKERLQFFYFSLLDGIRYRHLEVVF